MLSFCSRRVHTDFTQTKFTTVFIGLRILITFRSEKPHLHDTENLKK